MRLFFKIIFWYRLSICLFISMFSGVSYAVDCPASALATSKNSTLYLYYPTVTDGAFPNFQPGYGVTPLQPFDVSDLDNSMGTTAQLRNQISQTVINDYCEFSVDVQSTTTTPSPAVPRWQIVGIGSDISSFSSGLFGIATAVDVGDPDPQDYGRVFSQAFAASCGATLSGPNSTLARWGYAIGGTASHEAGHNYGLAHGNSAALPGETPTNSHLLATGSTGLTCAGRVVDRHFSDTSYSILGHNLGLNTKTLHNWDFVNPNGTNAHSMKIKVLSSDPSLSLTWAYSGAMSPWSTPTVSGPLGTQTYQGTSYNIFELTYSVAKSWSNGPNGIVPAATEFHLGATFANNVIVVDTQLFGVSNNLLTLAPRIPSYDAGDFNIANGNFEVTLSNVQPQRPLIVSNLQVMLLPRTANIDSMMRNEQPFFNLGRERVAIEPVRNVKVLWESQGQDKIELQNNNLVVPIANLANERHIEILYPYDPDCKEHVSMDANIGSPEVDYCEKGTALSLFPATRIYITATITEPDAKQWDKTKKRYINAPLETRIFFQLDGRVPDLNKNATDDFIDISSKQSQDLNRNGIPDEVEGGNR